MGAVKIVKLKNGAKRAWFWVCEEDGWCGAEFKHSHALDKASHHVTTEHTHGEASDHGLRDI